MTRWSPSEGRGLQGEEAGPGEEAVLLAQNAAHDPAPALGRCQETSTTLRLWPGPANELARHCPAVRRWAATWGARGRGLRVARGGARLVRLRSDGGGLSSPSTAAAIGPGQGRGSVSERQV